MYQRVLPTSIEHGLYLEMLKRMLISNSLQEWRNHHESDMNRETTTKRWGILGIPRVRKRCIGNDGCWSRTGTWRLAPNYKAAIVGLGMVCDPTLTLTSSEDRKFFQIYLIEVLLLLSKFYSISRIFKGDYMNYVVVLACQVSLTQPWHTFIHYVQKADKLRKNLRLHWEVHLGQIGSSQHGQRAVPNWSHALRISKGTSGCRWDDACPIWAWNIPSTTESSTMACLSSIYLSNQYWIVRDDRECYFGGQRHYHIRDWWVFVEAASTPWLKTCGGVTHQNGFERFLLTSTTSAVTAQQLSPTEFHTWRSATQDTVAFGYFQQNVLLYSEMSSTHTSYYENFFFWSATLILSIFVYTKMSDRLAAFQRGFSPFSRATPMT